MVNRNRRPRRPGQQDRPVPVPGSPRAEDPDRFGVDGMSATNPTSLARLAALGDGVSGWNGGSWDNIEITPGAYGNPQPALDLFDLVRSSGRKIHVTILPDHEDFMDKTGALWLRCKPEHIQTWRNFITYFVTTFAGRIDYLQIGNEPHWTWVMSNAAADNFAEMTRVAYEAAKAANPSLPIMGCGLSPEENFFLVDAAFLAWVATLSGPEQTQFAADLAGHQAGRGWCERWLASSQGKFDLLSMHFNFRPETPVPQVAWARAQMALNGYSRPIFIDDATSAQVVQQFFNTQAEIDRHLLVNVDVEDPGHDAAVEEYRIHHANNVIKKACYSCVAGVDRILFTWDVDNLAYEAPRWRNQGFFTVGPPSIRKAAYWSYQRFIAEIDGFQTATLVRTPTPSHPGIMTGAAAVKFTFRGNNRPPIVVAWTDDAPTTIDLADVLRHPTALVMTPVTTLDGSDQPILVADQLAVASTAIPISTVPVFVR